MLREIKLTAMNFSDEHHRNAARLQVANGAILPALFTQQSLARDCTPSEVVAAEGTRVYLPTTFSTEWPVF